jgi:hypothetical protein
MYKLDTILPNEIALLYSEYKVCTKMPFCTKTVK